MFVCYTHNTALDLLRVWSESHPLTVRAFHGLRPSDARHTASCALKTNRSIVRCANSEADAFLLIEGLGRPALRQLLSGLFDANPLGEKVHMFATAGHAHHETKRTVFHRAPDPLPKGSLVQLAPGVLCSSPEYLFLQMAEHLSFGAMVALGYELCGCYPLEAIKAAPGLVRGQLTTPIRIKEFVNRARGLRGVQQARAAIKHVQAKAASVAESEVSIIASLPWKRGGYSLPRPLLNERVELSSSASKIARSDFLVLDAYWPEGAVALEYDGKEAHSGEAERIRDSRRRDALAADGIVAVTVTGKQLSSPSEFEELLSFVERRIGRKHRSKPLAFREAHSKLRREIREFHCGGRKIESGNV